METTFPRRQVERSFRKFDDTATDLFNSKYQTWSDTFRRLITHCETDPVMQFVTAPLKANPTVDVKAWFATFSAPYRGTRESGYKLPNDDEERTALLYQVFLDIAPEGDRRVFNIGMTFFYLKDMQQCVDVFNREFVQKFTREVTYRLNDILEDLGNKEQVVASELIAFHYYDNTMNINGNIQGSNIASGGSTISNSSANSTKTYNQTELPDVLRQVKEVIPQLPVEDQVRAEVLTSAIEKEPETEGGPSVTTLAYAASLLTLLEKAGGALDVVEKFKTFFGLGSGS